MNVEIGSNIPSYVVFQMGTRRLALPREGVGELISSPVLDSFPHTTPGIAGVVIRRGRILPVLDLGPAVLGAPAPPTRFFLVVERIISNAGETCAIPVQGECELVCGIMLPATSPDGPWSGYLDINGEQVEVLDLQKAIQANAAGAEDPGSRLGAMS
jgi:hypothetical protein